MRFAQKSQVMKVSQILIVVMLALNLVGCDTGANWYESESFGDVGQRLYGTPGKFRDLGDPKFMTTEFR